MYSISLRLLLALLLTTLSIEAGAQFTSVPQISSAPNPLAPSTINAKTEGATGDFATFQNAVMTASSATLVQTQGRPFTPAAVGKWAVVTGADGVSAAPLIERIIGYTNSTTVTLARAATHATNNYYLGEGRTIVNPGTTGNYVPGDVMDVVGGTTVGGATAQVKVYTIGYAAVNAIVNAGTGATTATCTLTSVIGGGAVGSPIILRYAIAAGSITGSPTIVQNNGSFFAPYTVPTSISFTDNTGACGISGVLLNIRFGVRGLTVITPGEYSILPADVDNVATTAGSISGATGNTFAGTFNQTGAGGYGTDDTDAIVSAITKMQTARIAGLQSALYFPQGNYFLNGGAATTTALPLCTKNCSFFGDGIYQTSITAGPSYPGADVFSWINSWSGSDAPRTAASVDINFIAAGSYVKDLSVVGFIGVTTPVNAMTFYGRTANVTIESVVVWYMNSCLRGGLLTAGGAPGNFQESNVSKVRCQISGNLNQPVIQIMGAANLPNHIALPNNNNFTDINIYGVKDGGFYLEAIGDGISTGANNKFVDIRSEGGSRSGVPRGGDLFRIGTAGAVASYQRLSMVNVNLINAIADIVTPTYYCTLRITNALTRDITVSGANLTYGDGGSNALCIDGGSNMRFGISSLASALYEVTVASSTTVGENIFFDLRGNGQRLVPYNWSIDATSAAFISTAMVASNTIIYNSTVPTGAYRFNANLTGNTEVTFPLTGLLGSYTGTITTTTAVTWPTTANFVRILASSQGGCGGGGAMATLGTVATGAGAGGAGSIFDKTYKKSELGTSTTFTFGTNCSGGLGATVNGNGADGTVGASITWTPAAGALVGVYGGGLGGGGKTAASSVGGGSAGLGGAGVAATAGIGWGVAATVMSGNTGGTAAVGVSSNGNTIMQGIGGSGAGSSVTTSFRGGDGLNCGGGGSGGTLLAATSTAGGNGGVSSLAQTAPAGGINGGGLGGPAVLAGSIYSGGSAPGGGGGNTAGAGGNGGLATGVPCVGGAGGGAGTTRGGDGTTSAPATLTYIAW